MKTDPYQPRSFVPAKIDLTDTRQIDPLFETLDRNLDETKTAGELTAWIERTDELACALAQDNAITYIRMTCQTDDAEREKAYLKLIEEIEPHLKPLRFGLLKKLAAHPAFDALPSHYDVYKRSVKMAVRLYREENIPRQTEEAKLSQQYQKTIGSMTVNFDGREQTLVQMAKVQEEPDRDRREQAWKRVAERRLQDRENLESLYDRLLVLRNEMAATADFPDFREYAFASYERFDYTPQDCLRFQDAIEKHVVPLARSLQEERRRKWSVDRLRPWDLAVDPDHRPPLRPFHQPEDLVARTEKIFARLDPRLAQYFGVLGRNELLDLANRKGKAPGGYQSTLAEARLPFIFMNAVGVQRDVETLLHEAGHAFHTMASREQSPYAYRSAPIEFCEVASMTMELLTAPNWDEFYANPDEANRARRDHLEGIIKFLPWMATVDAFQHWIYTHPAHTREERTKTWLGLLDRFGGIEDWTGHEEARATRWHAQLHLFEIPFYYVEYGIAQLGALQLWKASREDSRGAIDAYLAGLRLGGSQPLPELFAAAGIRFAFDDATLAPLMNAVRERLVELAT
jgi:oligoendopeptidase F